jgi:hypothetical protein
MTIKEPRPTESLPDASPIVNRTILSRRRIWKLKRWWNLFETVETCPVEKKRVVCLIRLRRDDGIKQRENCAKESVRKNFPQRVIHRPPTWP